MSDLHADVKPLPESPADLESLKRLPIWVYCRGDKTPRTPTTGREASCGNPAAVGDDGHPKGDPKTWGTYADAVKARDTAKAAGHKAFIGFDVGVDLGNGERLGGIDLDTAYSLETGECAAHAQEIHEKFGGSYMEVSPGKKGLHILFRYREEDRKALGVETIKVFSPGTGREIKVIFEGTWLTVTENPVDIGQEELTLVSRDTLRWLLEVKGPAYKAGNAEPTKAPERARKATPGRKAKRIDRSADAYRYALDLVATGKAAHPDDLTPFFLDAVNSGRKDGATITEWFAEHQDKGDADHNLKNAFRNALKTFRRRCAGIVPDFVPECDDETWLMVCAPRWDEKDLAKLHLTPEQAEFLDNYAMVPFGNVVRVIDIRTFEQDILGGSKIGDTLSVFHQMNQHRTTKIEDTTIPLTRWWEKNGQTLRYPGGIVFDLSGNPTPRQLNLWSGFRVKAAPGHCPRIDEYIRDVISNGNTEMETYILNWLALIVQRPNEKPRVALVLHGEKGAGKDTFARIFRRIFGERHVCTLNDADRVTGRFNSFLATSKVVHLSEVKFPGNRDADKKLKALVTDPVCEVEFKGVDLVSMHSPHVYLMTTNEDWNLRATDDERRYCITTVSNKYADAACRDDPKRNEAKRLFRAELWEELDTTEEGKGISAFLHKLLTRPIEDFDRETIPFSEALKNNIEESLTGVRAWFVDSVKQGSLDVETRKGGNWLVGSVEIDRRAIISACNHWIKEHDFKGGTVAAGGFWREFGKICPQPKNAPVDSRNVRYAVIPSHRDCVAILRDKLKVNVDDTTTIDEVAALLGFEGGGG